MKISIVLGTARDNNESSKVADFIYEKLRRNKIETDLIHVSDYLFQKTIIRSEQDSEPNEKIENWARTVESSDAIIFVTPEYNHSYPGELKILIDSLYSEYKGKIAGVVSISTGNYGGARVTELLKLLLLTVNFHVLNKSVLVSGVSGIFEEKNRDHLEKVDKQLDGLIEEILSLHKQMN